jgi:small subunit ribosomal protein S2
MVQAEAGTITQREPITMKSLLEAGVHFGHQTRRWNPHMKRFIFTHRNGIHIIDLQQTLVILGEARRAVTQLVAEGGDILFVGTKKQAQEAIESEANRCGMPYINQRWLGGTLTNFQTISSRIAYMKQLEEQQEKGYFQGRTKREALKMDEEIIRLQKYFGGIRNMKKVPSALFVIDLEKEDICVAEARRMGIPVVAVVDSNCDPELVSIAIPGNDDAIRSIRLMSSRITDAILEGLQQREAAMMEAAQEQEEIDDLADDMVAPTLRETEAEEDGMRIEDRLVALGDDWDQAVPTETNVASPKESATIIEEESNIVETDTPEDDSVDPDDDDEEPD